VVVAHSDVCSWWRAVRGEEAPPAWDAYRDAVAAGLAAADALVAPTRAVAEGLDRDFGARVAALGGTLGPAGAAVLEEEAEVGHDRADQRERDAEMDAHEGEMGCRRDGAGPLPAASSAWSADRSAGLT